jgi:predicted  nucleic acid-binding Zn-ribbon protein
MRLAEQLAQLDELEARIKALKAEQAAAAARKAGDAPLAALRGQLQDLEARSKHAASQLLQSELEVETLRTRAKSQERSIYDGSVKHPADLQRRQHELETLRATIESREERELVEMEAQEEMAAEMASVRSAAGARAAELERQRGDDTDRAPQLAAELEAAGVERDELTTVLPAAALRTYQRTASRRQPPIARVVGGTCTGCRLPLPHRLLEEARHDALVTCENCERILVL